MDKRSPKTWLSIDPGTYHTGVCLWLGDTPQKLWLITCPAKAPIEQRLAHIIKQLEGILLWARNASGEPVMAVACESVQGYDDQRPNPEGKSLIRRINQWAALHKFPCSKKGKATYGANLYHASTVVAAVRPRGTKGWGNKEVILFGVELLYPQLQIGKHSQDEADSVAVGHCHLVKLKEKEITDETLLG